MMIIYDDNLYDDNWLPKILQPISDQLVAHSNCWPIKILILTFSHSPSDLSHQKSNQLFTKSDDNYDDEMMMMVIVMG